MSYIFLTIMYHERDTYLLCSSLVAEGAEFVRMSCTDLMQGSKVTGQISPKVLGRFREIRNILETQRECYRKATSHRAHKLSLRQPMLL